MREKRIHRLNKLIGEHFNTDDIIIEMESEMEIIISEDYFFRNEFPTDYGYRTYQVYENDVDSDIFVFVTTCTAEDELVYKIF